MTVSQVKEALGAFSIKLKPNIPRDVLDAIEYFGHVAVIPGRIDARTYGDGTLDSARYVGVLRKKRVADNGTISSDTASTAVTLEGVGMNFWLGDENDKGAVIEDEIQLTSVNFATAIQTLLPPAVTVGTVGGVSGTYSGFHQWQTPRKAIQYVCDTMSQAPSPINLISDNNSSFESSAGVGGWTASSNCSIAVTGAYSYLGVQSMQVTPTTVGALTTKTNGSTNAAAVTAGDTYVAYFWVLPTGVSCYARVGIDYRDGSYVQQGSASTDTFLALPQNAWTQVSRTFTVPTGSGITKADFLVNLQSNASGDKFYVDNVQLYKSQEPTPVSFQVDNRGRINAGPESDLFVTTPQCILVRQGSAQGEDLAMKAVPGSIGLDQDMEDFATRLVVLAGSDGSQFSVGEADIGSVSPGTNVYKDMHGNPVKLTKMVSESQTTDDNADTRAELGLRDVLNPHREVTLSADDYDIFGSFDMGDYVYVYDPDSGLVDTANEVIVRGMRLNPIKLQVTEIEWPVTRDYSLAFRTAAGVWYDLTDYLDPESSGSTKVTIGDFQRTLDDSLQTVQSRLGSNTAPDNLTPDQVDWVVGSFQTTAYLDKTGLARAQQKVTWLTPTNTDGSTVTDGDHYEIQYRLSSGHLYSQTWAAVSTLHWNQLSTWNEPVEPDVTQWETRQVTWGTNSLIINDMACGTAYDFRIRAIDTSNNIGAWSATEIVVTAEDNIPPSQPSAPTVASSLIAVQVIHDLGLNSGGSFNLERDIQYLEVHAQYEPGYTPDETTKLGNLLASSAMLDAQTPCVGTFNINDVTDVYIKVVAVDKSGNRSQPSPAAQSSATLIDDEHITNLSVSKITAGQVVADWIVSGSIKTGVEGQRLELNPEGIQAFNVDGDLVTNLSSNPQTDGSYISFVDTAGNTLASINSQGAGNFTEVNTDRMVIEGVDLMADIINPRGKGIVAWGYSLDTVTSPGIGQEVGYMELAFTAEQDRMYRVTAICDMRALTNDPGDDNRHFFKIRDGFDEVPTLSSDNIATCFFKAMDHGGYNTTGVFMDTRVYTPGTHRLLWSFGCLNSDSEMRGGDGPAQMWVEDMGDISLFQNTGYLNTGNGSTSAPENSGNFSTTYPAVWTRSYQASDDLRDSYSVNERLYQGYYDGLWGMQKSLIGFDYNSIKADIENADIKKIEVYIYMDHWYDDYGTLIVGTHGFSGPPSEWDLDFVFPDRARVENWARGAGYWVELPLAMATEFASGATTGVAIGPAPSTNSRYYGYARGTLNSGNSPKLRITYSQ